MPRPIFILAEPSDATAVAVATLLRRRHGPARVELRTPTELALAPRWEHRLEGGEASTCIALYDGTTLAEPAAIFNRISFVAMPALAPLSPEDRAYAQAEMSALF